MLLLHSHFSHVRLTLSSFKRKCFRGKSSPVSRIFRPFFEQKKVKTILGGNLAIIVLFASILSPGASALSSNPQTEITTLPEGKTELSTKMTVRMPVDKVTITQGFGLFHPGLDLDGKTGDPIYSIMKGKVESVIYDRFGLGNHLVIVHDQNIKSVYGHLSKIEVGAGELVDTDTIIGRMGATGMAFGDHLHLEVIDNDRHINPLTILPLK